VPPIPKSKQSSASNLSFYKTLVTVKVIMISVMMPKPKYVTFGITTLIVMTIDAVTINVVERQVSYSQCKQRVPSCRWQVSSAKMTSLGSMLTHLACHPTKRVNKAEELTYLSTNIGRS
jgi:hypothetical protein